MATPILNPTEYEVSVSCMFEAASPIDAVNQMIEWISERAAVAAYRVTDANGYSALVDAEDWHVVSFESFVVNVIDETTTP